MSCRPSDTSLSSRRPLLAAQLADARIGVAATTSTARSLTVHLNVDLEPYEHQSEDKSVLHGLSLNARGRYVLRCYLLDGKQKQDVWL